MVIQYEKTFQGAHRFYAIDKKGHLFTMQYMFSSKREALANFKFELKARG